MVEEYSITIAQKDDLTGRTFDGVQYFYPFQDINDDWFISQAEVNQCTNDSGFEWIHSLSLTEYAPPVDP